MKLPLALFTLALGVRALFVSRVLTPYGILPGGLTDEFYHLRRIQYSVRHFPEVLGFDPYVSFPDGGHIHWPPGFDWSLAALARLLGGAGDPGRVETVAAWAPAVLGALAVAVAVVVARAAFGRTAGVTAGLVLAFTPAHVVFSRVGAVDHHVVESLGSVALLGVAMAWLRAGTGGPGPWRSAALGLAMGLPFLAWPGFLLQVGIADVGLGVAALAAADRGAAAARARGLALAHGVALLVVLPFCLGEPIPQYGAWSPLVLSRFQPAFFGGAVALLAALALAWARSGAGRDGLTRTLSAAVTGVVAVGGLLLVAPGLGEALLYASGWFAEAEDFQTHVLELRPLDLGTTITRYSLLFFAFPFAWVALARRAWREGAADRALLAWWALVFLLLALLQRRFNNAFSVPYALVWGALAAQALPALRSRLAGRPGRAAAVGALALLALLVALEPVVRVYVPEVRRSVRAASEPRAALAALTPFERMHLAAARWLEESTPPTRGYRDADSPPEYGVLSSWSAGHLLRYRARRPMVQDNFGVYGGRKNYQRAWDYYAAEREAKALEILERLRVRYVVADRSGAGSTRPYPPRSMARRLAERFGSAGRVRDPETGRAVEVPALAHHRLVFHARSAPGDGLAAEPPALALGVWELVPGARVGGTAPPGALVEARLALRTAAGRRHEYRARARTGDDGRYALILPYPTDASFSEVVRAVGSYRFEAGGRTAPLRVREVAVQAGLAVEGPRLAP